MLTTYDKSDRFRLTNTLLDILHRLYVIKLLSTVGTQWVIYVSDIRGEWFRIDCGSVMSFI